jgi:hypothetical protein
MDHLASYSGFHGTRHLASGHLGQVASAIKALFSDAHGGGALIFDNATGRVVDIDFRGSEAEMLARLPADAAAVSVEEAPRGPGRPKLGVVAKEVTLLPRHWEWLAAQTGGASVALRKLVEEARRASTEQDRKRLAQERAYRFMSAMLANEPGLEEAERALFAGNRPVFEALSQAWPTDLRDHLHQLAGDAFAAVGADA